MGGICGDRTTRCANNHCHQRRNGTGIWPGNTQRNANECKIRISNVEQRIKRCRLEVCAEGAVGTVHEHGARYLVEFVMVSQQCQEGAGQHPVQRTVGGHHKRCRPPSRTTKMA